MDLKTRALKSGLCGRAAAITGVVVRESMPFLRTWQPRRRDTRKPFFLHDLVQTALKEASAWH
jgi:hypothetical protein